METAERITRQSFPFFERAKNTDDGLRDTLAWAWDVIAEPVLHQLGYTKTPEPGSPWPRLWWCPIGVLEQLPIHAAGRYRMNEDEESIDSVIDRVVSSYTPTLTALIRTRGPRSGEPPRRLTICAFESDGFPALPGVIDEAQAISRMFPPDEYNYQLIGASATRQAVADALGTHSWMHFAGIARPDADSPERSGFLLSDGWLTLSDLAAISTQPRELAFLSSDETASGNIQNPNENLHLAAAMQFIGYRHVIATIGPVSDRGAARITRAFYEFLTLEGKNNADNSAMPLHHVLRTQIKKYPATFILWAPYIHLGA